MKKIHAHELVVKTAREMAGALYEEVMRQNNTLYAEWKAQCDELTPAEAERLFIEMMYPKLLEEARATLAKMLGMAQFAYCYETLYDALVKDHILRQGRTGSRKRQHFHVGEDGIAKNVTRN